MNIPYKIHINYHNFSSLIQSFHPHFVIFPFEMGYMTGKREDTGLLFRRGEEKTSEGYQIRDSRS